MKRAVLWLALACLAAVPCAAAADTQPATPGMTSRLAPLILRGSSQVPELWLAQRTIDREWGPSDDSTYKTVDVPGWKSEGLALALSGAVPGAGQLYTDEGSGWFYLVGEAIGWAGRLITRHRGQKLHEQAAAFVGDPNDSSSTWSFARYASMSGGDPARLQQLWAGDRDAFYQAIASDPTYRAGFAGADPGATFESYRGLHADSESRFRQSRTFEMALWLNHALSAFDALRAAHIHNLPLRRTIDLQVGARMRRGEPQLSAALVRRF